MRQHTLKLGRSFFGAILLSFATLCAPLVAWAACPIGTPAWVITASDICDSYSVYLNSTCCPSKDLAGNCIAFPGRSAQCTNPTWDGLLNAGSAGNIPPPSSYDICPWFTKCSNGADTSDACTATNQQHAIYCENDKNGTSAPCAKQLSACAASGAKTTSTAAYTPGSSWTLNNPLGTTDIPTILGRLINTFLGLVGAIALLTFVYAGVMYMTSAGGEKGITKAKDTMKYSAIGIAIIIFAYAIATNYFTILTGSH